MEAWAEGALERLRAGSGRTGGARRLVVDFMSRQDCCLSVQEIHDRVRAESARVGIASVYRAVEGLVDAGLVQRIDLGDGIARFERADPRGEHHHHLVCDRCGRVEPFEDEELETALERLAAAQGFAVAAHDVVLRGTCADCR